MVQQNKYQMPSIAKVADKTDRIITSNYKDSGSVFKNSYRWSNSKVHKAQVPKQQSNAIRVWRVAKLLGRIVLCSEALISVVKLKLGEICENRLSRNVFESYCLRE